MVNKMVKTMVEPVVHVIDDDRDVRSALDWLFRSVELPVRSYSSADHFLQKPPKAGKGCIVTDVRMPGLSGLELQGRLAEIEIELPVIVLTGHGDVPMAVEAMKKGAFDFVEKPFDGEALLNCVGRAIEHSVRSAEARLRQGKARDLLARLTAREREVLDEIMTGDPNKRIAHKLGISDKTVEFHRANLMKKINVRSTVELIRSVSEAYAPKGGHADGDAEVGAPASG